MAQIEHIVAVLTLALRTAAREDDLAGRWLGRTALTKVVYLGDVAYARTHGGESFSGVEWRFHHFGPWCAEVQVQIDHVARLPAVASRMVSGATFDEVTLWSWGDPETVRDSPDVPIEVAIAVARTVHSFAGDLKGLLNHVYLTAPMMRAAPGEVLDLSQAVAHQTTRAASEVDPAKRARNRERLAKLRQQFKPLMAARLDARKPAEPAAPAPRFDEVYEAGVRWLDEAQAPFSAAEARVSPELWHSRARSDDELS